jgi:pullulanase
MIDSASFLAREYKLGGYRFDLMGVHDIETMNQLTAACKEINPNITIYGEPWAGGTIALNKGTPANQANARRYEGYGQFNDQMRDALIKGGLNAATARGWVSDSSNIVMSDVNKILDGMKGATTNATTDPNKTVNYVTCHDNYTLFDRFAAAGIRDGEIQKKMAMLANSVVFTSQGTTFMLAGEEFLRSKGGNSNSYDASYKINELNYSLKVEHLDMFANYQKLIALKQTASSLHLNEEELVDKYTVETLNDGAVIKVTMLDELSSKEYVIYHRNGVETEVSVDVTGYSLYMSTLNKLLSETSYNLEKFETIILTKSI